MLLHLTGTTSKLTQRKYVSVFETFDVNDWQYYLNIIEYYLERKLQTLTKGKCKSSENKILWSKDYTNIVKIAISEAVWQSLFKPKNKMCKTGLALANTIFKIKLYELCEDLCTFS